uniref:GDP-fucose protein O-fucosyltransferase 2 n=1 Tax=Hanusia phi TaxID=3032 RepID=A0A7S0EQ65_9CRYP
MSQDLPTDERSISARLSFAYNNIRIQSAMYLGILFESTRTDSMARNYYMSALRLAKDKNSIPTFAHVCRENLRSLLERKARNNYHHHADDSSSERFLVFRFWAGLSNRRQELIGMIGAARILNRTLVLPDMVEGRWMAKHRENRMREGVDHFHDLQVLSRYIRVIDQSRFVKEVVPKLTSANTELHVRDYAYSGQFASLGLSYGTLSYVAADQIQSPRPPKELKGDLGQSNFPVLAIDFSYRLLDLGNAGEFEFFNGTAEWTPRKIDVKFTPSDLYVDILKNLHFSEQIMNAGKAVMLENDLHDNPFLAVHLRRNDMAYWKNRQHSWPETDDVIAQIRSLARTGNVSRVFLATDAEEEEVFRIQHSLPQVVRLDQARMGIGEAQLAIVDQFVCSHSAFFLGNFWSTFSWAIVEERYKLGHATHTNQFFQAPLPQDHPLANATRVLR